MFNKIKRLSVLSLTSIVLLFSGCGEEDDTVSSLVTINYYPQGAAKVYNYDFYAPGKGGEDLTVDAPWFNTVLTGFNGSAQVLQIVALEVTCRSNDGTSSSHSPDIPSNVQFIATAAPNSNLVWLPSVFSGSGLAQLSTYIEGLSGSGNLRYRCEMLFGGFFLGAEDDPNTDGVDETTLPTDDFEKRFTFTARP